MDDCFYQFFIANIGNTFSASNISKYLKSELRSVSTETIYNYIEYCKTACFLHLVQREDLLGKKVENGLDIFYERLNLKKKKNSALLQGIFYFIRQNQDKYRQKSFWESPKSNGRNYNCAHKSEKIH